MEIRRDRDPDRDSCPPVVDVTDLRKTYGSGDAAVHALAGLDLRIRTGELVTVTGASGSGKSTFLGILGCLDRPTRGVYHLMGRRVDEMEDRELAAVRNRFIGFVFQTFNLLPRDTALRNVELPLTYAGIRRAERRERAEAMLERVGLAARAHHRPDELSGGERQRVAIARALVTRPALLLADEPTGNLDSVTGRSILDLMAGVHAEGNTVLMVTHDARVAAMGSRTLRLMDGRIVEDSGA